MLRWAPPIKLSLSDFSHNLLLVLSAHCAHCAQCVNCAQCVQCETSPVLLFSWTHIALGRNKVSFMSTYYCPGLILNQTDLHQACTFNATNWSHWSLSIKDTRRMCPTFTFHTKLSQNCQWCCDVEVGSWLSNPLLAMNKRFEKICQLNRTQYHTISILNSRKYKHHSISEPNSHDARW